MFVGVYLCLSGVSGALALAILILFVHPHATVCWLRARLLRCAGLALPVNIGGLIAFVGLSAWAGMLHFGRAESYRLPNDYLARGPIGWSLLALAYLGILAPMLIAVASARRAPLVR